MKTHYGSWSSTWSSCGRVVVAASRTGYSKHPSPHVFKHLMGNPTVFPGQIRCVNWVLLLSPVLLSVSHDWKVSQGVFQWDAWTFKAGSFSEWRSEGALLHHPASVAEPATPMEQSHFTLSSLLKPHRLACPLTLFYHHLWIRSCNTSLGLAAHFQTGGCKRTTTSEFTEVCSFMFLYLKQNKQLQIVTTFP